MTGPDRAAVLLVLGDQLFASQHLARFRGMRVLMSEDPGLCGARRHHKQKLVMLLAAMRAYRDELRESGWTVEYRELPPPTRAVQAPDGFESRLDEVLAGLTPAASELWMWEVPGKAMARRMRRFAEHRGLPLHFVESPMFVTPRARLDAWFAENRPRMASFYRWQRQRMQVLIEREGQPRGGRWSFDEENRKRLPARVRLPGVPRAEPSEHVRDLIPIVSRRFCEHPGALSLEGWWLSTTRPQAQHALECFLVQRLGKFGPYEDAMSHRDPFLFHSALTPALNLGLLSPGEVLERTLEHSERHPVSIASLEGFVRQLIGWREFVHGVYRRHSGRQLRANFFGHSRKLTSHWYDATTGVLPLDRVIAKTQRFGWAHHIERLMVASNLMTLCEIQPAAAYDWFTELFVDSTTWVMVPNVFGMGLFADGGLFASKPYICGSSYLQRMGDRSWREPCAERDLGSASPTCGSYRSVSNAAARPAPEGDWRSIVDGLYWRFIDRHRDYFARQGRLHFALRTLDRMEAPRRARITRAAEQFLERATAP